MEPGLALDSARWAIYQSVCTPFTTLLATLHVK